MHSWHTSLSTVTPHPPLASLFQSNHSAFPPEPSPLHFSRCETPNPIVLVAHLLLSAMVRFLLSLASARPSSYSDEEEEESECGYRDPISSPLIQPGSVERPAHGGHYQQHGHQFSILAAMVAALRKSTVLCSVGAGEDDGMDISWPTDVRHVAHVTFDRFGGFLGLPVEFQPQLPNRVPSASVSVFGVSANSMQCSYDSWGNSVPTILLLMQRHLYSQGGLQVEGIFRINAENSQELYVRDQLNRGIVPHGVDTHCLAGLIKAWFRELPTGVLDSLTPDQVMHCNTEEDCFQLARTLPPTEAALLDWAINLMADIVENEHHNKMNARNIAMVFAPNMTQMVDPLTALIHAVKVMNFLKTLIIKSLRERIEAAADARVFQSCSESPSIKDGPDSSKPTERPSSENGTDYHIYDMPAFSMSLFSTEHRLGCDTEECFQSFEKNEVNEDHGITSGKGLPINGNLDALGDRSKFDYGNEDAEGILHRLSIRKGVRKLCRHPVFQLSKSTKKSRELGIVSSTDDGREVWA